MNAIMNKTNTGKLLVAVLAMAMVIAGAVVVLSDNNEVNAATPDKDPFEGMYSGNGASYANGVFTVKTDTTITLTGDVGTPSNPLDFRISLADEADLTFNLASNVDSADVYITYTASTTDRNLVNGTSQDADTSLVINGNITMHLTLGADSGVSGSSYNVIAYSDLVLTNGATVVFSQSSVIGGTVIWGLNASINATNSTIVLDNSGGFAVPTVMNNSTLQVTNPRAGNAFINLQSGSSITNGSTITIPNQNMEDGGTCVYIADNGAKSITITDSTLNLGNSDLVMVPGTTLTADGTTINAGSIVSRDGTFSGTPTTITGATINANLGIAYVGETDITSASYALDGVTVQTMTVPQNVTISSETGIVVTGNLSAASATVDPATQIIVSSGAKAALPAKTDVYVASGAGTVTVGVETVTYNSNDVIVVDTAEELIAAASAEGAKISITGSIDLNDDLIIGNGTEVSTGDFAGSINLGTETQGYTITKNGTGYTNIWLNSDSSANQVLLQLNGAFEASVGSIDVTNAVLTGDNNKIIVRSGEVKISGSLNGTLSIEGDTSQWGTAGIVKVIFDDFTVSSGAKLILNDDFTRNNSTYRIEYQVGPGTAATQNTAADIANFYLYGAIVTPTDDDEVVINVDDYANFQAFSGASIQQTVTVESVGTTESTVNLGDSLETIRIGDDVVSSNTYSQMQTVLIIDTLNLRPNTTTTIMGQLVIEEGVTLTVMNGATLIIDSATAQMIVTGQIEIEVGGTVRVVNGDEVTITGSITSDGTFYVNSTVNIENGGSVLIDDGEGSTITVTKDLNVKAGGELTIRADMNVTGINNEGTVILNGANLVTKSSEISMAADGAVVDIRSFTADAGLDLTITDDGLVLEKDGNTVVHQVGDLNGAYPGTNKIVFNGNATYDGVGVRGVTVTEVVTSERDADIDDIVWYGSVKSVGDMAAEVGVAETAPMGRLQTLVDDAVKAGRTVHFLPPYRFDIQIQLFDLLRIDEIIGPPPHLRGIDLLRIINPRRSKFQFPDLLFIEKLGQRVIGGILFRYVADRN